MALFSAVLDANVLVPIRLVDTLLRLAERDLFRPLWTAKILEEARRALVKVHPDLDPARIDARFRSMNEMFEGACVTGWEPLVEGLKLPDPDDRHVVAAALRGGAETIVTANLVDFPKDSLEPLGLHAVTPDEFLLDALDLDEADTLATLDDQVTALRRPPMTLAQVVSSLEAAGAPGFAAAVRARTG